MRGKLWFLGGAAVGFVIGARAGRENYDRLGHTRLGEMLSHDEPATDPLTGAERKSPQGTTF